MTSPGDGTNGAGSGTGFPDRPIKLIALDLDGTLIGHDLEVSRRNRRAIRKAQEAGVLVSICTGRMFQATLPFARRLRITTPLICYQGAWIGDPVSGERLFHQPVPLDLAREVVGIGQGRGYTVQAYVDDAFYVDRVTPEARIYEGISLVKARPVGNLLEFLHQPPTKVVIVTDEQTTMSLVPELAGRFGEKLFITRSYPLFTEAVHPSVSKGLALARLAELCGVDLAETMAVGDNLNDYQLVQAAGFGVAMGNAAPEVKSIAQHVTASVAEDGVAEAIERFVLASRA
ncbi:MAG: Cof-type HAD-IIB family hydrolase [Chloroflexota bacterium]